MIINSIFSVLLILVFTGCSAKKELVFKSIDKSSVSTIITEDDSKFSYIKKGNSFDRFCAPKGTDVEKDSSNNFSENLSDKLVKEKMDDQTSHGVVNLGGRTPDVLIIRELMYRACELTLNLNTDVNDSIEIYKMFLNSVNSSFNKISQENK